MPFATEPNHTDEDGDARSSGPTCAIPNAGPPWAIPGTPGLTHRIGGLEKADGSGDVSYDPANHELMTKLRVAKVAGIAADIPPVEVDDPGWRGRGAGPRLGIDLRRDPGRRPAVRAQGHPVAHAHLRHLNPFPANLGDVVRGLPQGAGPGDEPRPAGQAGPGRFPGRRPGLNKMMGKPFQAEEIEKAILRPAPRPLASRRKRALDMTDVAVPATTKKDWTSDQEIRWCPGCGDYSILTAVQMLMPELGARREDTVFVSGIGCSSRFPYYMNTYGVHSIHGRAPAVATGVAVSRPDLHVWVITGDGDALSIGGNHLLHALRRNVNLTIILFNNQIYGLTKGQYSPTSETGKVTKSTPFGSLDYPYNPLSLALGAEATFVARTHDMDRKHMMETFRRAYQHQGASLVEVYQNCNVFNDGAFELITSKDARPKMLIPLAHGEPIRFGPDGENGVVLEDGIGPGGGGGRGRRGPAGRCTTSTARIRAWPSLCPGWPPGRPYPTPIGVFRDVERPDYGSLVNQQLVAAAERRRVPGTWAPCWCRARPGPLPGTERIGKRRDPDSPVKPYFLGVIPSQLGKVHPATLMPSSPASPITVHPPSRRRHAPWRRTCGRA